MVEDIQVPDEYTLDDLLADAPSVTVEVGKKSKTFWVRPPTDTEKAMAMNAARIKSRELRDRLMDSETEEHTLLVKGDLSNMTEDEQRLLWFASNLFQKTFEINRRSMDQREDFFVEAPEGSPDGVIPPSNEDWDRYESERRTQEMARLKAAAAEQKKAMKALEKKSKEIPVEDLATEVQPWLVERQASREWQSQYGMQVLVRCTFLDAGLEKRAFDGPEQAMKLHNTAGGRLVLDALLAKHQELLLDPDLLKN